MQKVQPYAQQWYKFFEEGKIMGLKCDKCGAYEFPPVSACNKCGSMKLSWAAISGEARLVTFSVIRHPDPPFQAFAPYVYGNVILKEGPSYSAMILGADPESAPELYKKLPIAVKAEVQNMVGYKIVAFRVKA